MSYLNFAMKEKGQGRKTQTRTDKVITNLLILSNMIKYVIQAKKNPLMKNEVKYYPQAAPTTPVTLAQIVKRIEKRSTVSSADVKAVLDALQYEVIDALENGNTVCLGDIGSFRLTIRRKEQQRPSKPRQRVRNSSRK